MLDPFDCVLCDPFCEPPPLDRFDPLTPLGSPLPILIAGGALPFLLTFPRRLPLLPSLPAAFASSSAAASGFLFASCNANAANFSSISFFAAVISVMLNGTACTDAAFAGVVAALPADGAVALPAT